MRTTYRRAIYVPKYRSGNHFTKSRHIKNRVITERDDIWEKETTFYAKIQRLNLVEIHFVMFIFHFGFLHFLFSVVICFDLWWYRFSNSAKHKNALNDFVRMLSELLRTLCMKERFEIEWKRCDGWTNQYLLNSLAKVIDFFVKSHTNRNPSSTLHKLITNSNTRQWTLSLDHLPIGNV